MIDKICKHCKIKKPICQFDKYRTNHSNGVRGVCHLCLNMQKTNRRNKTLEVSRERELKWTSNNRDKIVSYKKRYVENNKEKVRASKLKYNNANKEKIACRRKNNIQYVIASKLRRRLYSAIKCCAKVGSAVGDLGCSIAEFKEYMENMFYPNPKTGEDMRWENWTLDGWHIDHIEPFCNFDLSDREQLKRACHYSNLQPLWAKENLSKGARYE